MSRLPFVLTVAGITAYGCGLGALAGWLLLPGAWVWLGLGTGLFLGVWFAILFAPPRA